MDPGGGVPRPGVAAGALEPRLIEKWDDVVALVGERARPLWLLRGGVRPARGGGVHDPESGCVLPGLPVLPLSPAGWWTGPVGDWAARQVVAHLAGRSGDGGSAVLAGEEVGRGWDGETLLGSVQVVALLGRQVLLQAQRHHREQADGRWPAAEGDVDWVVLTCGDLGP
jgi:hypothetical protein